MKAFWKILRRYVAPYKGYVGGSVVLNILSAIFNVFSFSLLIPILQILFNISDTTYEFIPGTKGCPSTKSPTTPTGTSPNTSPNTARATSS